MVNRDNTEDSSKKLQSLRKEYSQNVLDEGSVDRDPQKQFSKWFDDIHKVGITEPNAMTLATVGLDNKPSLRVLLLKGFSAEGFVFYTNYESRKGRELQQNPNAAILFFWPELERQIRIEGVIEKLSAKQSDEYFLTRPRGAQLGAIASPQSQAIKDRVALEERVRTIEREQPEKILKRPFNWGGYRLIPSYFEFWQGREDRLHDRIVYERNANSWQIGRLAP